jgi:protein ImuB
MLWLGVYLPCLPLEVFQAAQADAAPGQPNLAPAFAICSRSSVELANAPARALGVHPGQKRATALALAPRLIIRERDPAREQQALQQLGSWALQYTPRLSLQVPEQAHAQAGLLLDIEASLRLFGGLEALLQRLRLELQALGYCAVIGCAPTATAAWLFACWQDGLVARTDAQLGIRLAQLPVELLASLETRRDTVEAIGVRVFRDLAQLPRNGLARRFGKALLLEMDLALGRQPELRSWFEAPLQFASTLELLADVEHAEALLFAARRQLCELAGWLAARHAAVRCFVLEARHDRTGRGMSPKAALSSGGPVTLIEARFASPAQDADRMLVVLRERLAITRLPAAVHTLHLRCEDIVPAAAAGHGQLFPVAASTEESLGRLVERLQARLGRDQVQRVLLAADHRPEAAYRIETVEDPARRATAPASCARQTPRPLWLLHQPIALRERNQRPWWRGPLKLLSGPERIEGGWWDCNLVQRDYFIAEDDHAQWFWIYRTRGNRAASAPGGAPQDLDASWYLQGIFG